MKQALAGQRVSAEEQRVLDDMRAKMVALFREEMSWDSFEPMLLEIYRKSFSEDEVPRLQRLQEETLARLKAAAPKACCS